MSTAEDVLRRDAESWFKPSDNDGAAEPSIWNYLPRPDAPSPYAINGLPGVPGLDPPGGVHVKYGSESESEDANGTKLKTGGPSAEFGMGKWKDEEGKEHRGMKAKGNLGHAKIEKEVGDNMWDFEIEGPGGEAGIDLEEGKLDAELEHGKMKGAEPKTEAELSVLKAKLGFASHKKDSDHDRGFHAGVKIGKKFGEKDSSIPVHFSRTDKDGDGNYEYGFGADVEIFPGVTVSADYETETPVSDIVSSDLLGPLGMPLNFGMHALGLGDYSPGTLLHDGVSWLGDKITGGGDKEASPLTMAMYHRQTQRRIDEAMKSGMSREKAEEEETGFDFTYDAARDADKKSTEMYDQFMKAGMTPEAAENTAAMVTGNTGWSELRQLDRSTQTLYDANLKAGMSPELAQQIAQTVNPDWQAPAAPKPTAPAAAPPAPAKAPMCRAPVNDNGNALFPFLPFAD